MKREQKELKCFLCARGSSENVRIATEITILFHVRVNYRTFSLISFNMSRRSSRRAIIVVVSYVTSCTVALMDSAAMRVTLCKMENICFSA